MSAIDLTPPDFLLAKNRELPPRTRIQARLWHMPSVALTPVLAAVGRGRDTIQKLRQSCRRYTEAEIQAALRSALRTGAIERTGRRYRRVK